MAGHTNPSYSFSFSLPAPLIRRHSQRLLGAVDYGVIDTLARNSPNLSVSQVPFCKYRIGSLSLGSSSICMRVDAYLNSNHQLAIPAAVHSKENDVFLKSSSASISHRKEVVGTLPGDSPLSIVEIAELNANMASRNENPTSLGKALNTVDINSLHADTNLLPSGAFLDKTGNANMEPYLNLLSSLVPFSSRNLSGLPLEASPVCHQNTLVDQSNQQGHKRRKLHQTAGSTTLIEPKTQSHLHSLPIGIQQEPNTLKQALNNSSMNLNPAYSLQQQAVQCLLSRNDIDQLQDNSPQLKALIQHQLQNQFLHQILHSSPNSLGAHSPQSGQQMKNQLPYRATHQTSSIQSTGDGICSQRLTQYIHHLLHRPKDNSIVYWRKFVLEFYAPGAKERWCLSSYENVGKNVLGVLSLGTMDSWCCDICGTKSGKGFEASFEILPRLCKMKFESGTLEEILFLEFPRECRLSSGIMMLEYGKAIQESIYEQFRVVREGKLRVIFRHDLKILSWEFCAHHHEEYVPRRLVAPQVNQLVYAAHKYQSSHGNPAPRRVPAAEVQGNCNMFLKSVHQLAKHLDLPILNDLGFSKRHVRCLQIIDVVNSMKDLMDFSIKRRIGPIESLQTYPHAGTKTDMWRNVQNVKQETLKQGSSQDMQTDGIRSMAMHLGPEIHHSDAHMTGDGVLSGSGDVGSMLAHYHQKTAWGNILNTKGSTTETEQSCLMGNFSQRATSSPFLRQSNNPAPLDNSMLSRLPSARTSEAISDIKKQMIDKWLQEMVAESRAKGLQNTPGKQDQALHEFNANILSGLPTIARVRGTARPGFGYGTDAAPAQANLLADVPGSGGISRTTSNINTLKISGSNPSPAIKREPDLPEVPEAFMGGQFSKK
nr:probable transcriptional regulator SLK3 [Coffea arabica]